MVSDSFSDISRSFWTTCPALAVGLSLASPWLYLPAMPLPTMPSAVDRESEVARRHPHPERETLELAAAGAAQVLGAEHSVTMALAKASITMGKADLWHARLAIKMLRKDQREAIAEVGESRHGRHHLPLPGGGLAGAVVPHRKTCGN